MLCLVGLLGAGCGSDPAPVELSGQDNGTELDLANDQEVDLTLQTIGPGQYGEPTISSSAVRFEGTHLSSQQNPGGPRQIYQFRAVGGGSALISIPHDSGQAPFTFRTRCCAT